MMINPVSTIVAPLAALALLGTAATVSTIYPVLVPVAGLSNGGRRGRDAERTATGRISAPTRRTELEVKLKEIEVKIQYTTHFREWPPPFRLLILLCVDIDFGKIYR